MKVLMLNTMPFRPAHNGSRLRAWHILRHIAKRHEVTCIAMHTRTDTPSDDDVRLMEEDLRELRLVERPVSTGLRMLNGAKSTLTGEPFTYLNFRFAAFERAIREAMSATEFDLVHARQIHTLQYADSFGGKPVVLDSEGLAAEQWRMYGESQVSNPPRRWFCLHQANLLDRAEPRMNKRCDAVITCSLRDKEILEATCPSVPYVCVPNGVDTAFFTCLETEQEPASIVYTSALDYAPNADAVVHFVREVLPLVKRRHPNARLYLVGKDPVATVRALARDDVIVTGTVDDVRPYVARAQVFVVPLRVGQGTRLKVVEAMSMGKAIVSTSVGAEGIECVNGGEIVIADAPEDMAAAISRLFEDGAQRQRLGRAARALAVSKYDWSLFGGAIDDAYEKALLHARERAAETAA